MLRTILIFLLIAPTACLNASCFPFTKDSGPREIRLTAEDHGRTIKASIGSTLIVSLESNPSTGYTWEAVGLDTKILQQAGDKEWAQNPGTEGMVGAPGMMCIRFEAVGRGATRLSLIYHRTWESDPPAKRFGVDVNVK